MPRPIVIAHRGDSSRALENSLEAFRLALAVPADMIEFDIRRSRDNQLYVMHDERTGRTCDRDLHIEKSTSEELAAVRLKNGEPIPALHDVLALVQGKARLNIEIKSAGAGALAAAHIVGSAYRGPILISSFKEREVQDARRVMPDVAVAGIFDTFVSSETGAYRKRGYGYISLRKKTVTQELVAACHERNIRVYVWTVEDEDEARKFVRWGVDGIYSNDPAKMLGIVE